MKAIADFCDLHLGKSVVYAKDTPNFIANRIGTFSMLNVMRVMQEMDLSVEEVDALTGTAVGWPKTGTFRLGDMVGLDILGHVVRNGAVNIKDERSELTLPPFFNEMLNRKWLGDKTKGGFYKKQKGPDGEKRFALDWKTLEYREQQRPKFPALEMAKNIEDLPERLRTLIAPSKDKANTFLWNVLTDLWTYSANRVPEIADSIVEIDKAMKTGFNWEMGPFELWDAAGVAKTVERMKKEGRPVAANVEKLLASGKTTWYADDASTASGRKYFDIATADYKAEEVPAGVWSVTVAKKANGVVKKNAGASLIDLGDGVGCIEFHSKMNALGGDIVSFITQTLKPGGAGDPFDAFVITNDAGNFSVGANIMMLLMAVQEEEWDEVDMAIRQFQNMTQAIKFSLKPVVVAPFGMCLGGGTEITLHAHSRRPHAELYAGLVEVGVGLLPGGGGCKEMTLRAIHKATHIRPQGRGESVELMEAMKQAFEIVAMAKVSTSALEAKNLGFISPGDTHHHEPRARPHRRQDPRAGTLPRRLPSADHAYRHPCARRKHPGNAEDGGPHHAPGRVHQRPRGQNRRQSRGGSLRRRRQSRHAGQRTIPARPRARGFQVPLRREEDAGAYPVHAKDRQDAEELTEPRSGVICVSRGRKPAVGS